MSDFSQGDDDDLRASISELVRVFRSGLLALLPVAETLNVRWRGERQQAAWERLAYALFDTCVRGPIETDVSRRPGEYPLPPYDIDMDSYSTLSWIAVVGPDDPEQAGPEPSAVTRLVSDASPFDTVEAVSLHPRRLEPARTFTVRLAETELAYVRRSPSRENEVVRHIRAEE